MRKDGLERAHARGHRVEFVVVMVVVVVMIVCHVEELAPGRSRRNKSRVKSRQHLRTADVPSPSPCRYRATMRVLILGGNGFIGSEICRVLGNSHAVTALARHPGAAARRMPGVAWLRRDLATMQRASDWALLADFDIVVNAAGALQDGARDDVAAVQHGAMLALYQAAGAAKLALIVQISARVDGPASRLSFLASKRRADEALARSSVPFVIIRPAVVIGRNAHGGSALLRGLAAAPWRTPLVHAETPMQFAALDDVAQAVRDAVEGRHPAGQRFRARRA